MALHEPANSYLEQETTETTDRRARLGLWLFGLYFAIYLGFMGLNAFAPGAMLWVPFWGLNLAIVYGFALILAAVVLALIYVWLARVQT